MALSNATVSKNILIGVVVILVLVVLVELAWGAMALFQKPSKVSTIDTTKPAAVTPQVEPKAAALMVQADKKELKVGEVATFTITISSTTAIKGTDTILSFDPKLFTLDKTSTTSAMVKVGTLFDTYQENQIDEKKGTIVIAGINESTDGKKVDGVLGTFTLKAKAKGVAKLDFVFSPGHTTDSNVVESKSGDDVLQQVKGVELIIK